MWSQNRPATKKLEMSVSLHAEMAPKNVSAAAAPKPENKPERRPYCSVFRMQRMPIGPTGAAMQNPRRAPFKRNIASISGIIQDPFVGRKKVSTN